MKRALPVLTLSFALALDCAPQPAAEEGPFSGNWESNIESFSEEVRDLQERLEIPGLAFAIVEDGRVLVSRAFGMQLDQQEPFATSTPVNIQSTTKVFTAVLVMQSVSDGQLDLAAPIHPYLPESGLPREVQIEHLLTHTSEGVVGEEYVYSGNRYGLLQGVIEGATGQTLEQLIRKRILEPASMKWYDSPGLGAGWDLVSTADELTRFVQALDRGELLAPSAMRRLETPTQSGPRRHGAGQPRLVRAVDPRCSCDVELWSGRRPPRVLRAALQGARAQAHRHCARQHQHHELRGLRPLGRAGRLPVKSGRYSAEATVPPASVGA